MFLKIESPNKWTTKILSDHLIVTRGKNNWWLIIINNRDNTTWQDNFFNSHNLFMEKYYIDLTYSTRQAWANVRAQLFKTNDVVS